MPDPRAQAFNDLLRWLQSFDGSRDCTDEARWYASGDAEVTALPESKGEFIASLEVAFAAGQRFQRFASGDYER